MSDDDVIDHSPTVTLTHLPTHTQLTVLELFLKMSSQNLFRLGRALPNDQTRSSAAEHRTVS